MSAGTDLPLFFSRNSLTAPTIAACLRILGRQFPGHASQPLEHQQQGGCSYTLKLVRRPDSPCEVEAPRNDLIRKVEGEITVVQFRLDKHAVDVDMAMAASRAYSPLAPVTKQLGELPIGGGHWIQVLGMSCIDGERYSDVQPRTRKLDRRQLEKVKVMFRSLSTFFAKQWYAGKWVSPVLSGCPGKVGSSLIFRLESLERHLPTEALRERARWTREGVESGLLDAMPVCLTHGDLTPSNIIVDKETWIGRGYVDWAEAEVLPYGLCQYGVEDLLGFVELDEQTREPRFVYYEKADELRAAFYTALDTQAPAMACPKVRKALTLALHIGMFLWHGFAWDDGNIDRVVTFEDDPVELAYLEAFMAVQTIDGDSPVYREDSPPMLHSRFYTPSSTSAESDD